MALCPMDTFFYTVRSNNTLGLISPRYSTSICPIASVNQGIYTCPEYRHYYKSSYPTSMGITKAEAALKNHLRLLWEQHVVWTRLVILSIVFDLPDVNFVTKRLLRNPKDFEAALKPLYGDKVASKFADLFQSHLVIAAQLVKAAKAGDNKAAAEAEKKWYANADEIAAFLGSINPYWSEEEWKSCINT